MSIITVWNASLLTDPPTTSTLTRSAHSSSLRGGSVGIVIPPNVWCALVVRPKLASEPVNAIPSEYLLNSSGLSFFLQPLTNNIYSGSTSPAEDHQALLDAGDAGYGFELVENLFNSNTPIFRVRNGFGDSYTNRRISQVASHARCIYNGTTIVDQISGEGTQTNGNVNPSSAATNYDHFWFFRFRVTWPSDGSINQRIAQFNIVFTIDQV